MHWGDYGCGWGIGFGLGWFLMVIFWILVILGIFYLIKVVAGSGKGIEKEDTPLNIVKKRYAKGDITKEEFEKIKDDLTKE